MPVMSYSNTTSSTGTGDNYVFNQLATMTNTDLYKSSILTDLNKDTSESKSAVQSAKKGAMDNETAKSEALLLSDMHSTSSQNDSGFESPKLDESKFSASSSANMDNKSCMSPIVATTPAKGTCLGQS